MPSPVRSKVCHVCGVLKTPQEYARNGKGLASRCKECHRTYAKEHYAKNKASYLVRVRKRANAQKKRLRSILNGLKRGQRCLDCKRRVAQRALHFDHLPGFEKICNVSEMVQRAVSKETLLAEVAKCELVCESCHGKRSWARRQ